MTFTPSTLSSVEPILQMMGWLVLDASAICLHVTYTCNSFTTCKICEIYFGNMVFIVLFHSWRFCQVWRFENDLFVLNVRFVEVSMYVMCFLMAHFMKHVKFDMPWSIFHSFQYTFVWYKVGFYSNQTTCFSCNII